MYTKLQTTAIILEVAAAGTAADSDAADD